MFSGILLFFYLGCLIVFFLIYKKTSELKSINSTFLLLGLALVLTLLGIYFDYYLLIFLATLVGLTGVSQFINNFFTGYKKTQHKRTKHDPLKVLGLFSFWVGAAVLFVISLINLF